MIDERIIISDLADELQVRKQILFKVLKRIGIQTVMRREVSRRNQNVATITSSEASAIRDELRRTTGSKQPNQSDENSTTFCADDVGMFYLIQLEPEYDSGRFKVGFTTSPDGRLRKHRCSAPFAQYLQDWPCRRTWEKAAIDCVTNGCEQLHTEVFRTTSIAEVASKANAFFSIMPTMDASLSLIEDSEEPYIASA